MTSDNIVVQSFSWHATHNETFVLSGILVVRCGEIHVFIVTFEFLNGGSLNFYIAWNLRTRT